MQKFRTLFAKYYFPLLIIGLLLNFVGSLVLIFGALPSDEQINKISGTYFNSNKYHSESLKQNRNFAQIGLIIFSVGFLFEFIGILGDKYKK